VGHRALASEDLSQVVILNVLQGLFVVLDATAAEVVEVVDDAHDGPVLDHGVDEGSALVLVLLLEVDVENTHEDGVHLVDLVVVHLLKGVLVLELEALLFLQQHVHQVEEVYDERQEDEHWVQQQGEDYVHEILALVGLSTILEQDVDGVA